MKKKTINLNQIRISGKFPVEKTINLGEDVIVQMRAGCVKKEIGDNQEGTVDVTYILKPIEVDIKKG